MRPYAGSAPGRRWSEETLLVTVVRVVEILDAVRLFQEPPAVKGIDVEFLLRCLVAAQEMAGHADACKNHADGGAMHLSEVK